MYELSLERLQQPEHYRQVVLQLRKDKALHDLVQLVLATAIEKIRPSRFHIQPEKYGISNGRIDLALYHTPRTIVHIELIASCQNGHVFRDTTSLLASRADARLAILIDPDVDPT